MKRSFLCLVFLIALLFSVLPFNVTALGTSSFGYDTLGTLGSHTIENSIRGSLFTITEAGTADSITVGLLDGTSPQQGGKIKCVIYLHSDLSLVNVTQERTLTLTATATWYTFNFSAPKASLTANTEYVLCVWESSQNSDPKVVYDAGVSNQGHTQSITYNGFPNPLVPTHTTRKYSIFCNYTVSAGGQNYPVELSQSVSASLNTGISWSAKIGLTQQIETTYATFPQWIANVGLGQTATFSWIVSTASAWTVGLSQTIQTLASNTIQWFANLGLSQSFMLPFNVATNWMANINLNWITTFEWVFNVEEEILIDFASLGLSGLGMALSFIPLLNEDDIAKALGAAGLIFSFAGVAMSLTSDEYALPIAALGFIITLCGFATGQIGEK